MQIVNSDCLKHMKTIPENSVDSIVTDPPYGMSFMGKKWDYDVPSQEIWEECLRVLKPGGYLLSFAGTRTQHRMAVRIEDAGFEIRDMICWIYGSGFPKSLNIGKAVDKIQGNEREVVGRLKNPATAKEGTFNCSFSEDKLDTKGTSQWEGWGTALKPALEPITVARKPIEGTVAGNVLKWGVGGLNIDASRVGTGDNLTKRYESSFQEGNSQFVSETATHSGSRMEIKAPDSATLGRFPANLIHDGSDEVADYFPNDSQRFFYCAKASKSERNMGCEGLEEKKVLIGAAGHKINPMTGREVVDIPRANNHPTVKPLALMEYLIKLVTPKGGVVLDPFAGSGSTLVAAKRLGYDFIGIELTEEYIPIIEARLNAVKERLL